MAEIIADVLYRGTGVEVRRARNLPKRYFRDLLLLKVPFHGAKKLRKIGVLALGMQYRDCIAGVASARAAAVSVPEDSDPFGCAEKLTPPASTEAAPWCWFAPREFHETTCYRASGSSRVPHDLEGRYFD